MNSDRHINNCCIKQCTNRDRKKAKKVSKNIANAINNMDNNLDNSVNQFVSNFADAGVYSTAINPTNPPYFTHSNFYGRPSITEFLISKYGPNGQDTNVSVKIRKTYWDCITRTLSVERTFFATNNVPNRTFAYPNFGATNPVVLQPGDKYSQDQFVFNLIVIIN